MVNAIKDLYNDPCTGEFFVKPLKGYNGFFAKKANECSSCIKSVLWRIGQAVLGILVYPILVPAAAIGMCVKLVSRINFSAPIRNFSEVEDTLGRLFYGESYFYARVDGTRRLIPDVFPVPEGCRPTVQAYAFVNNMLGFTQENALNRIKKDVRQNFSSSKPIYFTYVTQYGGDGHSEHGAVRIEIVTMEPKTDEANKPRCLSLPDCQDGCPPDTYWPDRFYHPAEDIRKPDVIPNKPLSDLYNARGNPSLDIEFNPQDLALS